MTAQRRQHEDGDPLRSILKEAMRMEAEAIAKMLEAEAAIHENAAAELERDYSDDGAEEESRMHRSDAMLLSRMAGRVRSRS